MMTRTVTATADDDDDDDDVSLKKDCQNEKSTFFVASGRDETLAAQRFLYFIKKSGTISSLHVNLLCQYKLFKSDVTYSFLNSLFSLTINS